MKSITKKASSILLAGAMAATLTVGMTGTAFADQSDGTTQQFTISVDGVVKGTVNYDDLSDDGELATDAQGYLFLSGKTGQPGTWNVICARNYITLDALFDYVGVESDWESGASLEFRAYSWDDTAQAYVDEPYTKWDHFTWDDIYGNSATTIQNRFYTDALTTQGDDLTTWDIQQSPVIAFSYKSEAVPAGKTSGEALNDLMAEELDTNTRFLMGLNENTVNAATGEGWNMGKRLPSSITNINIVTAK